MTKKGSDNPKGAKRIREGWSSIELPTEIWQRLVEDAKARYISPSALARQILADHYGMIPGTKPQATGT